MISKENCFIKGCAEKVIGFGGWFYKETEEGGLIPTYTPTRLEIACDRHCGGLQRFREFSEYIRNLK